MGGGGAGIVRFPCQWPSLTGASSLSVCRPPGSMTHFCTISRSSWLKKIYQLKGTGREKNIHLPSVFQSSSCWLGICNPLTWEGTPEDSALGKAHILLKTRLGLFQARFCVYMLVGVGVFTGEVRMCEERSRNICRAPLEGR